MRTYSLHPIRVTMDCEHIQRWSIQTRGKQRFELLPKGYKGWQFWVSPSKGFGQGYVTLATDETAFQLVVNEEGIYHVLGIASKV